MIEFDAESGVANEGERGDAAGGGRLRVVAGRDYGAREQLYILYGRYSNAKLLYRYVLPMTGKDFKVRVFLYSALPDKAFSAVSLSTVGRTYVRTYVLHYYCRWWIVTLAIKIYCFNGRGHDATVLVYVLLLYYCL